MSKHIIITGTGRAGTTLLVQLCTKLGLDTGFASVNDGMFEQARAGMELLLAPGAPRIVKTPGLCDTLEHDLAAHPEIEVEHAIVPVRTLFGAAESRRDVVRRTGGPTGVAGGLWGTDVLDQQEEVLARKLYQLVRTLAVFEIPTTLLDFPRFVYDDAYLERHLLPIFPTVTSEDFRAAFAEVVRPEFVHAF